MTGYDHWRTGGDSPGGPALDACDACDACGERCDGECVCVQCGSPSEVEHRGAMWCADCAREDGWAPRLSRLAPDHIPELGMHPMEVLR